MAINSATFGPGQRGDQLSCDSPSVVIAGDLAIVVLAFYFPQKSLFYFCIVHK